MKCYRPSGTVKIHPWYGISHGRDTSGKYPGQSGRRREEKRGKERLSSFPTLPFAVPLRYPSNPSSDLLSPICHLYPDLCKNLFYRHLIYSTDSPDLVLRVVHTINTPSSAEERKLDFPCFSPVTFTKPGLSGGFTLWHR